MDGIFSINKPLGATSHDVVARVRRLAGQKRVGHTGTLDPLATGVLPICLGQATRVAEYLSDGGKAYRATIRFGVVTDTYDAEGEVRRTAPVALMHDAIAAALPAFVGRQWQVPPVYSAIKRGGQPLYKLARAGAEVAPEPRQVEITALRVVSWASPDLVLDVTCGKGTYIRSLAYDLGERLGPGAHLAGLVRTRSGPFTLAGSLTLEQLEVALADGTWRDHLHAADEALLDRRAAILGAESEARLRAGQPLRFATAAPAGDAAPPALDDAPAAKDAKDAKDAALPATESSPTNASAPDDQPLLRAYSVDGRFLGILRWEPALAAWHPHKVLAVAPVE